VPAGQEDGGRVVVVEVCAAAVPSMGSESFGVVRGSAGDAAAGAAACLDDAEMERALKAAGTAAGLDAALRLVRPEARRRQVLQIMAG
jgi:hypothetical protein